jgi:uncharacterized protein YqgV (UPF0045/DUF77 family)
VTGPVRLRVEVTVEPFVAGDPGPHVTTVADTARAAGLDVEVGPFGTAVTGPAEAVLAALAPVVAAAASAGASRLTLQVEPA